MKYLLLLLIFLASCNTTAQDVPYMVLCFTVDEEGPVSAAMQVTPDRKKIQGFILRKDTYIPLIAVGEINYSGHCEIFDENGFFYYMQPVEAVDLFNGNTILRDESYLK